MNYDEKAKIIDELIQQDRYPEALVECSKLFKANPKDEQNIEKFVFLFNRINDGNYDFDPDNAEQYIMRGISCFYKGEVENSIDDYNRALKIEPNHDYALKSRAFSLKMLDRFDEAIADLNKAILIKPSGEYFDDLAEIYDLMGNRNKTLECHQKAVDHSPNNHRLWYNFGVTLAEDGNLLEAVKMFDVAIQLWPQYEDAIVNRQYVLDRMN